jgi:hypothetical protein
MNKEEEIIRKIEDFGREYEKLNLKKGEEGEMACPFCGKGKIKVYRETVLGHMRAKCDSCEASMME